MHVAHTILHVHIARCMLHVQHLHAICCMPHVARVPLAFPPGGSSLTTPCPFSPCPHVPTQAVARGRLVAAQAVQRGTVTEVTLPVTPAMVPRLRVVAFFQARGQVVAASWGAPVGDSCGDQVLLGALGHTGSGGGLGAARGAGMYWGEGARSCWEHWNVLGGEGLGAAGGTGTYWEHGGGQQGDQELLGQWEHWGYWEQLGALGALITAAAH